MNWTRVSSGVALIVVVILSVYFGAVAAAPKPSPVGPALTLYQYGSHGQIIPSATNVFEAGQLIWIGVPNGVSSPYTLTITSLSGLTVFSQQNSTFPTYGLISVSLSPTLFPTSTSFTVALQSMVFYSPGFSSPQTSKSSFTVLPSFASIQLKSFSFLKNNVQAQIELQDNSDNPLTSVRVGLFLLEGNNSLELTTERTDLLGGAGFNVGESLSGGNFHFELRVLDGNSVFASPIELPNLTVGFNGTQLTAWIARAGTVESLLVVGSNQSPVAGRLVVMEERLSDGNWTVSSQAYTDKNGVAFFSANTTKILRVSFDGDDFYSPSQSNVSNSSPITPSSSGIVSTSLRLSYPMAGPGATPEGVPCSPTNVAQPGSTIASSGTISPDCGGGGTSGTIPTTSSIILPSSAYATIPLTLTALIKDNNNNPVSSGTCSFINDQTQFLGYGTTNSTGYATFVWTPGMTGSHIETANFLGNSVYNYSYSPPKTLNISPTPTTIELLKPQQIAFSWDLSSNIVIPVVTLTLARSGIGNPANIYMPPYSGASTNPPSITGYGWAGLNQTASVTMKLNGTYSMTQTMNWTRNFYMPPCPSSSCSPSTTPATGRLYFSASLSPPSILYSNSSTTLNIPYQRIMETLGTGTHLTQTFNAPSHLYVNVTSDYPFLTLQMRNLPLALETYQYYLDHSIGGPTSSSMSGGYTYYQIPSSASYARVCTDPSCSTPASGVNVSFLNGNGQDCADTAVDAIGLLPIWLGGTGSCKAPLPTARIYTSGTNITLTEFFQAETGPTTLYTNFQGYAYSAVAALKTGHYIMPPMVGSSVCALTILYPNQTYPAVECPDYYSPEMILNVEKHPLQSQASFSPAAATILNNTNATIQLEDFATSTPLSNSSFNYTLTRNNPNPGTVLSGRLTTNLNGTSFLALGPIAYGNYTFTVSKVATSLLNALTSRFNFTIYKALPTLFLSVSAIPTTPIVDLTPPGLFLPTPSGTASVPSIFQVTSNYTLQIYMGEDSPMDSGNCSGSGSPTSCVRLFIGYGTTASAAVSEVASSTCGPSGLWSMYYGPSGNAYNYTNNGCSGFSAFGGEGGPFSSPSINCNGMKYCYGLDMFYDDLATSGEGYYEAFIWQAWDKAGNYATTTSYAYIDFSTYPSGFFLVNGQTVMQASAIASYSSNIVSFQFDATNAPSMINFVSLGIGNETGPGAGSFKWITYTNPASSLYFLGGGTYSVTATFNCSQCAQSQFTVLSLQLTVGYSSWIENAVVGQPYSFKSSLANNATGILISASGLTENVYVNSLHYGSYLTDSGGNVTFTWTPPSAGQYIIMVKFPSQSYYANSSAISMISAQRRNIVLAAVDSTPNPLVDHQMTWNVTAQDMIGGNTVPSLPVSLLINGSNTTTVSTSSTGYAIFTYNFTSKGSYNVTFVSATTNVYNSATSYNPLNVYLTTSLTIQAGTIIVDQQTSITVTLKDQNGNALASRAVSVSINGVSYANPTTGGNGQASFNWSPSNTGNYTVAASYSATGSSDVGYEPASASVVVNVKPQVIINTQTTGSGTQSVSLSTAQGSPASGSLPLSIQFTDPFTIILSLQVNGKTVQASSHISNDLGWHCYWWGCTPYWKVQVAGSVPRVLTYQVAGGVLGGISSINTNTVDPPPVDLEAANNGVSASMFVAAAGDTALALGGFYAGAIAVQLAVIVATAAGLQTYSGNRASQESYLEGLLFPAIAALPCALSFGQACPEIPEITPGIDLATAYALWAAYEFLGVILPWFLGGFVGAGVTGLLALGFMVPALYLSYLLSQ